MLYLNSVRVAPGVRSALAVAAACVFGGHAALASEGPLSPIVISATRTPTRLSDLAADVTVIEREQIERAAGRTLLSLLGDSPGVQVSSNGGLGKSGAVNIRGGDNKQTVVLIDGMRFGSATLGEPSLENIPLDQIERIEIVRGAMASLYGADAASGVIQIFTRKGREGFWPTASVTLGSDRYSSVSAGFAGGQQQWTYSLQANNVGTSGFSATNPRAGSSNFNPDRDGFNQSSVSANLGFALNAKWKLQGNLLRSSGVTWFDDGFGISGPTRNTNADLTSSVTGLTLSGKINEIWESSLRVSESRDVSDDREANKGYYIARIATRQRQWTWENQLATPVGRALIGLEWLRQDVDKSTDNYTLRSRTVKSLVLGLNGSHDAHDWQLSARNDRNSQFGREFTGSVGYGLHLDEAWRVGVLAGTSFVAPSFNQLYWPNFGNPTLKPQHGLSREVNVGWDVGDKSVKLTRYDNRIHDFILTNPTSASNVDGVRLAGWTLAGALSQSFSAGRFYANGSLDWLDAHNMATGAALVRRADRSGSLKGGMEFGRASVEVSVRGRCGTPDTNPVTFSPDHVPGHGVWGASASWNLTPDWKLALRADNIGNHGYETSYGYNQPVSQYFVTLSHAMKSH